MCGFIALMYYTEVGHKSGILRELLQKLRHCLSSLEIFHVVGNERRNIDTIDITPPEKSSERNVRANVLVVVVVSNAGVFAFGVDE